MAWKAEFEKMGGEGGKTDAWWIVDTDDVVVACVDLAEMDAERAKRVALLIANAPETLEQLEAAMNQEVDDGGAT